MNIYLFALVFLKIFEVLAEEETFDSVPSCLISPDGKRWYGGENNNGKCFFGIDDTDVYAVLILNGLILYIITIIVFL